MAKDRKLEKKFHDAVLGILYEFHRKEIEAHPLFKKFVKEWRKKRKQHWKPKSK
jgi:hypothetical protein